MCERDGVPGLESIDPRVHWQELCSLLFGPDTLREEAGDALQPMLHYVASESGCQLGFTPVTNTHKHTFLLNTLQYCIYVLCLQFV